MKYFYGLLICLKGTAQTYHIQTENVYAGSGAYSTHFTNVFSFLSNPATLGNSTLFSAGILAERKWMLKELDNYVLALSGNLSSGGIGILFQQSGDKDFNERSLALAYGKNLGKVDIGVHFNYQHTKAAGYQGVGFGYSGIGLRFHATKKLITGWEFSLPVFGSAGKSNPEKGSQLFKMGFGYEWREDLFLSVQIIKSSGTPLNVIPYVEYRYGEYFLFSFGLNSDTGSPFFKFGWKKNRLCIQMYSVYNPILGFSPGLLLIWENKNKKEG